MKKTLIILLLLGIIVFGYFVYYFLSVDILDSTPAPTPSQKSQSKMEENDIIPGNKDKSTMQEPEMNLKENTDYQAILTTDKGKITIDLFEDKTPITVNNFVSLSEKGFYDNTIFHRIIDGFMIQGGDPEGTGRGGPGYRFDDEPFDGEYSRGTVAMANAGPNTNGSQFFIMHADYNLPKNYVIFGKVVEGMDVVDAIATTETKSGPSGENSTPVEPVTVQSVEIVEK